MFQGGGFDFQVVFFDGEREMYIGDINISPLVEYKLFQFMISHKIGVSPNQISIYLVDRRKNPRPPFSEERRKLPITGKVDFGSICRHVGCFFLVVLKRTRKFRNRREKTVSAFDCDDASSDYNFPPLLRLDEQDQAAARSMENASFDRIQRLLMERENQQRMAMGDLGLNQPNHSIHNGFSYHSVPVPGLLSTSPIQAQPMEMGNLFPRITKMAEAFCPECTDSDGETTPFHPCVNDSILVGYYKSMFGPITPPNPQASSSDAIFLFSPAAE